MSKVFEHDNYLRFRIIEEDNEDEIVETYNISMKNTLIRSGNEFSTFVFLSEDIPDFSLCVSKNNEGQMKYSKREHCCNYSYKNKVKKLEVTVDYQDSYTTVFSAHDPLDDFFTFTYKRRKPICR